MSEQKVAQLEEDKKHIEFMASMKKYDADVQEGGDHTEEKKEKCTAEEAAMDLFPDEEAEERNGEYRQSRLCIGSQTKQTLHRFTAILWSNLSTVAKKKMVRWLIGINLSVKTGE